ncbi:unnamed protein product, partial [Prorocentrum cordatum]
SGAAAAPPAAAGAQADLAPLIREVARGDVSPEMGGGCSAARWWSRPGPGLPLLCPVSEFPVCMLPYPPFKLRADPERAHPYSLVDGKFLAVHVIATGRLEACGRALAQADVAALDDYIHRCKLGPRRVGRFVQLSAAAAAAAAAGQPVGGELGRLQGEARAELAKLRRIQDNRLAQISRLCQARSTAPGRGATAATRGRPSKAASSASTRASSGSAGTPVAAA